MTRILHLRVPVLPPPGPVAPKHLSLLELPRFASRQVLRYLAKCRCRAGALAQQGGNFIEAQQCQAAAVHSARVHVYHIVAHFRLR